MKVLRGLCLTALIVTVGGSSAVAQQHGVTFDTDFAVLPRRDGMVSIPALHSPEIDQRTDIPVYRGANMPLVHEASDSATRIWIDPTLVTTRDPYVDVDATAGIHYGISVGDDRIWTGAEGAQRTSAQYDLDWDHRPRRGLDRWRSREARFTGLAGPAPGIGGAQRRR